jgi:hypothetical protein
MRDRSEIDEEFDDYRFTGLGPQEVILRFIMEALLDIRDILSDRLK